MSDSTKQQSSGGVGFLGLLGLLFIGLKLGDVITWSWWWVTCPLWAPAAIVIVIVIVAALALGIWAVMDVLIEKWECRNDKEKNKR